ncbi:MAG TPA: cation diffusion facilitator family transporter [Gaiellaceae bacterium]|nr:cation diffusion facilitator family transporter [Gaiellaceae bacterium]
MHAHEHGAAHAHAHGHGAGSREQDRRALGIALGLILVFMAGEVVAGILAGSLALLADAGHMLTDAAALAGALVASRIAARRARGIWTFGFGRVEILAAQANGISLLLVAAWIVYAAVRRLIAPPEVHGLVVVVVACAGIVVNIAATASLLRANRESLNVRGAYLHILTDLAAFVGTAVAGGLVLATGWARFDPIAGLLVAALMLRSSWTLLRESGRIFLEASPTGIDPDEVAHALVGEEDVVEVHDLHVWQVTSGFPAFAAHVLVEPDTDCHDARRRLEHLLEERFGLRHTTLQVDHIARRSQDVELGSLVSR